MILFIVMKRVRRLISLIVRGNLSAAKTHVC